MKEDQTLGKIAEKAVCKSVFLTIWHCIFSAELTKTHSFRLFFQRFCPLGTLLNQNISHPFFISNFNFVFISLVDGGWSEWAEWKKCEPECGFRTSTRLRTCTNPKQKGAGLECDDKDNETRHCEYIKCNHTASK